MTMSKKCCCITLIVASSCVVVLAVVIGLIATCVIPGLCLDRSPLVEIVETKDFYTGTDNYLVGTGNGFWYMYKGGITSGTQTYTIYYDDKDEPAILSIDLDTYDLIGITKDYALLSLDDDEARIVVLNHDGTEAGEFTMGCNETFMYFGNGWISSQNPTANKVYFYY